MKIRNLLVTNDQLEKALNDQREGDLKGGHFILRHIIYSLNRAKLPDERAIIFITQTIEKCLEAYYSGKKIDLSKELGLGYSQQRPPMTKVGETLLAVKYGEEVTTLMQDKGYSYQNAIEMVAKSSNVSQTKVKTYYSVYKKMNQPDMDT